MTTDDREEKAVDERALEDARQIRTLLEAWASRMTQAATTGRSATIAARMATARAAADLRRVSPKATKDEDQNSKSRVAVAGYLERAIAVVTKAAREIERNRYSLPVMQAELERLEELYRALSPGDEAMAAAEAMANGAGQSTDADGSADDRGADGEIGSGEDRPLET